VSHRLGSFSGSEKQEGSMGVFFGIYADGALLLLELWPHPRGKGSVVTSPLTCDPAWGPRCSSWLRHLSGSSQHHPLEDWLEEVRDHRCWLTDVVMDVCSQEVSSNGIFRSAGGYCERIICISFQKLTEAWCNILLFVRCNHIMLKRLVMKIFVIKFVHGWKWE